MNYFANHPGISLEGYNTVNATGPAPGMSPRYSFIPTTTAVGILADSGWQPVQVTQARTRDPFKAAFGTHSLRFQNTALSQNLKVGSTIPQIALRNGHSGESAFVLDLALLELRCLNGLMADLGGKEQMRITHRGFDVSEFEKALRDLVGNFDNLMGVVDRWRSLQVPLQSDSPETLAASMTAMDALEQELITKQRALAQPPQGLHPEAVVAQEDVADPGDQHPARAHSASNGETSSGWKYR